MVKAIKSLELHYPMFQFLISICIQGDCKTNFAWNSVQPKQSGINIVRGKTTPLLFRDKHVSWIASLFRGLMKEYSCDYRVYTRKIYIIRGKLKNLKVQLLRSKALFLCRHEDTSSLRLLSDKRSGRQIIKNFSFRQRLHLYWSCCRES